MTAERPTPVESSRPRILNLDDELSLARRVVNEGEFLAIRPRNFPEIFRTNPTRLVMLFTEALIVHENALDRKRGAARNDEARESFSREISGLEKYYMMASKALGRNSLDPAPYRYNPSPAEHSALEDAVRRGLVDMVVPDRFPSLRAMSQKERLGLQLDATNNSIKIWENRRNDTREIGFNNEAKRGLFDGILEPLRCAQSKLIEQLEEIN